MTLDELHDLAWSRIEAGLSDSSAAARTPALATSGPSGPEIRTLVLRAADRAAGTLDLHVDAASPKVAQLGVDPRAALHVWDADASLQVRMRGRAEVLTGKAVEDAWEAVPEGARTNYGGTPAPGEPMPSLDAYQPGAERGRFAVLRFHADEIDALHLGERQFRAVFGPGGLRTWVAP